MKILFTLLSTLIINISVFSQAPKVGDKAPEIVQTMPNGEEFNLSSLKGQMVLIDFWASWCGPCRKENPNMIAVYNKYKDASFKDAEGFNIVSVSLDMKKDKWEAAIEMDKLIWPFHVSDLKGWRNDVALTYKISSVPTSYLINGEGVIIAKNLRGEKLEKALKKNKKGLF